MKTIKIFFELIWDRITSYKDIFGVCVVVIVVAYPVLWAGYFIAYFLGWLWRAIFKTGLGMNTYQDDGYKILFCMFMIFLLAGFGLQFIDYLKKIWDRAKIIEKHEEEIKTNKRMIYTDPVTKLKEKTK